MDSRHLSIKVRKDGTVELLTADVPTLDTLETLVSGLEDLGVTIDTPSPNPALSLRLCG